MQNRWIVRSVFAVVLAATFGGPLRAQGLDYVKANYTKHEHYIRMRDGVRLYTTVYVPKDHSRSYPILLNRTPYSISPYGADRYRADIGPSPLFGKEGFIIVYQDVRGRWMSEGEFEHVRPHKPVKSRPRDIDESTDTYDTIEWLLKNVPHNNGRVGMKGVSYPGWLTVVAMLDPHPALKAASPQASPADMFLGDDFHHNGAFRLSYGFEYAARMETSKQQETFEFDRYDTFQWYLDLGPLANVNTKHLHGKIPTWNDFVAHPNYDAFWQRQGAAPYLTRVTVPTLTVAGWWDQEDFYGPLKIYELLEPHDTGHVNSLVVGPWNHGGWAGPAGDKLGAIDFGSPASRYFQDSILAPWFAHFLKDRGEPRQPEALTFEAGANQWRSWDAWPPRQGTTERRLYFQPGGRLSFEAPTGANAFDSYVSDPANPVPYRHRPIPATYTPQGSGWPTWLVEDQ